MVRFGGKRIPAVSTLLVLFLKPMFCFCSYSRISEKIQLLFIIIVLLDCPKPAVQKAGNSLVAGLCSALGVLSEGSVKKVLLSQEHFDEWEGT